VNVLTHWVEGVLGRERFSGYKVAENRIYRTDQRMPCLATHKISRPGLQQEIRQELLAGTAKGSR
jgi:hypothetical protein